MIKALFSNVAYAATVNPNRTDTTIEEFINRAITGLGYLIWVVILLSVIYSGYLFVTSSGDPDKLSKAKRALLYAILAVVIVSLANIIVYFFTNGDGAACLFTGSCSL